jgi:hypothetical protein
LKNFLRNTILSLGALLLLTQFSVAQIQVGDNVNLSANGTLASGFSGSYGNLTNSTHDFNFGGNGALTGDYYSPNFLSFSVQPFYNQSRANSSFQSLTDSSGVSASTSLFGGSHFPGSISYSRNYNSSGNYAVPGLPDYVTHGNGDSFAVGWGLNLPGLPNISTNFQTNNNAYSIYGTDGKGTTASKVFTVRAFDRLDGFSLNGTFSHAGSEGKTPLVLTTGDVATTDTGSNSYSFNVAHALPMKGQASIGFSRNSYTYDSSAGAAGQQSVDNVFLDGSVHPWRKVSFSGMMNYDDNLGGTITQSIISQGGPISAVIDQPGSNGLTLTGEGTYTATESLVLSGQVERRDQNWFSAAFGSTSYRGTARYSHILCGGALGASMSVAENQQDGRPGMTLGFTDSVSYSRPIGQWRASGHFNYSQNDDTVLISYMTSNYSVGGNISRRFGLLTWSGGASTARTALTDVSGSTSSSESFSTGLNARQWFAVFGSYQRSSGSALQTAVGLTPTPVPIPVLNQALLVIYGGHSYSMSASSSAIRHFTGSVSYSRSFTDTTAQVLLSNNQFGELTGTAQYQFRKLNIVGGYTKFSQGISIGGIPASRLSSFYIGVNRWFNFF